MAPRTRWTETRSSTRSRPRRGVPALALALLLGGTAAWSAPASSQEEARAAFNSAQKDYAAHRYENALRGYQHAYGLAPLPALLFDIAQCERKLQRWARAESDYRRYVAAAPDASNRPLAQTLAEEMHAKAELAQLRQKVNAPDGKAGMAPAQEATAGNAVPQKPSAPVAQRPSPPPDAASARPSLAPRSLPEQATPLEISEADAPVRPAQPVYKKWWFWTGVGVVAAGATTAVLLASKGGPSATTLGEVNLR